MKIKFGNRTIDVPCNKHNQFSFVGFRVTDNDNEVLGVIERGKKSIFIRPTDIARQRYFVKKK